MRKERLAVFKLCIFGDGGVGKSSLINRFLTKVFDEDLKMTIGADFSVKDIELNGREIRLRIWDFAGEEKFRVLMPSYVQGADGGVFMYDTTRYNSLSNLEEWLAFFKSEEKASEKVIPLIMVGGKTDLKDKRAFPPNTAEDLAKQHELLAHLECSSKTGENIEMIFETITKYMLDFGGFQ